MKVDIGECLLQGWTSGSDESDLFCFFGTRGSSVVSIISNEGPGQTMRLGDVDTLES